MDTTTSRGGGAAPGPASGPDPGAGHVPGAGHTRGAVGVEVASMPDGRTIRFYATASLVSGEGRYGDAGRSQAAEPQ